MLRPCQTGVFSKRSLRRETVDVSDLGNDTGGINLTDSFDGSERVRNSRELLLDRFVVFLDLLLKQANSGKRDCEYLVYGIRNDRWRSIRIQSSLL